MWKIYIWLEQNYKRNTWLHICRYLLNQNPFQSNKKGAVTPLYYLNAASYLVLNEFKILQVTKIIKNSKDI